MSRDPRDISKDAVAVTLALRVRAGQFGFPVKGAQFPKPVSIGMHGVDATATRRVSPQPYIECPYCHAPLQIFSGNFVRIVGLMDPRRTTAETNEPMLAEVATPTMYMGSCDGCAQSFFFERHALGYRPQ